MKNGIKILHFNLKTRGYMDKKFVKYELGHIPLVIRLYRSSNQIKFIEVVQHDE